MRGTMNLMADDDDEDKPMWEKYPIYYKDPEVPDDKALPVDTAGDHTFILHAVVRAYDDRVVVRWMPDEYMSFRFCNDYGYQVVRLHEGPDSLYVDTLAACIKPLSIDGFTERFEPTDSLAAAAVQTIYGRSVTPDQTRAAPGSMGSIMEVYEQQQMLFGYAALIAERRFDLAEAMGLAFVDRTAEPGKEYAYSVIPLVPDSVLKIRVSMDIQMYKLGDFKGEKFETFIEDSIAYPNNALLMWDGQRYSTFDIERRMKGETEWKQLNQLPYVYLESQDYKGPRAEGYIYYNDELPEPGEYEYRIYGYDLFGDRTQPTDPHTVVLKDLVPPSPAHLYHIEILRSDSSINAQLFFSKDTLEADFVGYLPFYNNPQFMGEDTWIPMLKELVPPTDTTCIINCMGMASGRLVIAAVDTAGNVSQSAMRPIDIADLTPPGAPTNLRYTSSIEDGTIRLVWDAPEDNDILNYQVFVANDTTHMFLNHATVEGRDTVFIDTVSMDVNQKYIYYKVRTTDFSTNQSEFSPVIQVLRPSLVRPQVAHLDSAYQDSSYIHMTWICSNEAQVGRHKVYRRRDIDKDWTLLSVHDGDSVKLQNNRITIADRPRPYKGRWVYAVETFSPFGLSRGPSLGYTAKFDGYKRFPCPAVVEATLVDETLETRLAWDIKGTIPDCDEWYWCVYRKGPSDKEFKFLLSSPQDKLSFSDTLIHHGETAEYFITLIMPAIGESLPSNIVRVKAKPAPDQK